MTHLAAVGGELVAEEAVGDEDLGDDVDKVEALAEEKVPGPSLVLGGLAHALLHVLGQLGDLVLPVVGTSDVSVQSYYDVLR